MANFAEIDKNNVVVRVLITDNNDPAGDEGLSWLKNTYGGRWIQTSYNQNFRFNYAGVGMIYDEKLDAFYPLQPYPSWILSDKCQWQAPISAPTEGIYKWDEKSKNWQEVILDK
jgi:hypothetical protein